MAIPFQNYLLSIKPAGFALEKVSTDTYKPSFYGRSLFLVAVQFSGSVHKSVVAVTVRAMKSLDIVLEKEKCPQV